MSELTSFLMDITILTILACNSIAILALRARIDELKEYMDEIECKEHE